MDSKMKIRLERAWEKIVSTVLKHGTTILSIVLLILLVLTFSLLSAQGVAINNDNSAPDASAIMDIKSTTKGMLIPRMTTAQRTTISSPAEGLLVFDQTTNSFWFHNGTGWAELTSDKVAEIEDADNDTKIQVEESADEDAIRFDVAGTEAMIIDNAGNVGVGTTPTEVFEVKMFEFTGWDQQQTSTPAFGGLGAGWQSFTAGYNGQLTRVSLYFRSTPGTRTLTIYEGEGTGGALLHTQTTNQTGSGWKTYNITGVQLNAGEKYTIWLNDRINWQYSTSAGAYTGGISNITGDYAFRTYMVADTGIFQVLGDGIKINDYTLPLFDGSTNQVLATDGSGNVSWASQPDDQTLSLNSNTLAISNGNSVDLSAYMDDTDDQALTFSKTNGQLSITDGNTVDIATIADANNNTKIQVEEGSDDDHIRFDVNGTEAMVIDNSGNVGIGTTPTEIFDVKMFEFNGLDQQQTTIPGSSAAAGPAWQSFTAGVSGELTQVSLYLTGSPGTRTITIYEGEGTGGVQLHTQTTNIPGSGSPWKNITIGGVQLTTGEIYTIGIDSRFGWRFSGSPSSYPLGRSDWGNDYAFRTYMVKAPCYFQVLEDGLKIAEYTLPATDGASGQVLTADGAGNVSWVSQPDSQTLSLVANTLSLSNGNSVDLSAYLDDTDTDTDDQTLSFSKVNAEISIADGNTIEISSIADADDNTKVQVEESNNENRIRFDVNGSQAMIINNNGRIGIGTNSPTKALVQIEGNVNTAIGAGSLFTTAGAPFYTPSSSGVIANVPLNYSLYASDLVGATSFMAFSDKRIKKIHGRSSGNTDLETLMKIEIMDYTLIDSITKGNQPYKKVIAQQLNEVYPLAVKSNTTEVIPDIYTLAEVKDGWIMLEKHTLNTSDRIQIITPNGTKEIAEVCVTELDRFQINSTLITEHATLFIYGREVNDFHTVDYEAIGMLNVSATQELYKLINDQQHIIESQQTMLNEMLEKMKIIEAKLCEY